MSDTLTRLQPGHLIEVSGDTYHVVFVNDCRARCVPMKKQERVITPKFGEAVTIQSSGSALNISPNSDCPIVGFKPVPVKIKT